MHPSWPCPRTATSLDHTKPDGRARPVRTIADRSGFRPHGSGCPLLLRRVIGVASWDRQRRRSYPSPPPPRGQATGARPDRACQPGQDRAQGGEVGHAGSSVRAAVEPGSDAVEVDRGAGDLVLQGGLGQAAIARPPQIEAADALRDGGLDTGQGW
jgi:hypothetical protein